MSAMKTPEERARDLLDVDVKGRNVQWACYYGRTDDEMAIQDIAAEIRAAVAEAVRECAAIDLDTSRLYDEATERAYAAAIRARFPQYFEEPPHDPR